MLGKHFDLFFWILFAGFALSTLARYYWAPTLDYVATAAAAMAWIAQHYPQGRGIVIVCPSTDIENTTYLRCRVHTDDRVLDLDCHNEGCRPAYSDALTTRAP